MSCMDCVCVAEDQTQVTHARQALYNSFQLYASMYIKVIKIILSQKKW
jgi:hypothetical protein